MTEILLTFQIPHKEKNKLPPNSKIQETDRLTRRRAATLRSET